MTQHAGRRTTVQIGFPKNCYMKIPVVCLFLTTVCGIIPGIAFGQPTIIRSPTNQSVSLGANVTLTVSASGILPLHYQWDFNQTDLLDATNRSLILINVQLANAGEYRVIITNSTGSATSQVAVLDIDPTFTKISTGFIVTNIGTAAAAAWGDYDNDGFIDLAVTSAFNPVNNTSQKNLLFRNNHDGTFAHVTNTVITTEAGDWRGCAWADYNNDGLLDLFATSSSLGGFPGQNELFRNNGDGTFTKMTASTVGAGIVTTAPGGSEAPLWADYDNDGFLDLFIARYGPDWLFHNNGDGSFNQVTNAFPGDNVDSYGGMWADYDNDGYLDLFIGNSVQHLAATNSLFHNNGDGMFNKILVGDVATNKSFALGSVWGDYDNDGNLDLFVVNNGHANSLYRNNGDGTFTTMTSNVVGSIASDISSCLGASWADYENDGYLDLFVTTDQGINLLYHNNGDGTFTRQLRGSLVNDTGVSVSGIWGDFDNDGFLDLFIARGGDNTPSTNLLFHNNTNNNAWVKFKLVGAVSNRSAIGAKVRVKSTIGGHSFWQMRQIMPGSGFSTGSLEAHFGLGHATNVDLVRIEWPSGIAQTLTNVAPKQSLTIIEHQENAAGAIRLTVLDRSTNGTARLFATSKPNLLLLFEASTNLVNWVRLGTRTNLTGTVEIVDRAANLPRRFYRASAP